MQIREKLIWFQDKVIVRINAIIWAALALAAAGIIGWGAGQQAVLDCLTPAEREDVQKRLEAVGPPPAPVQQTPAR